MEILIVGAGSVGAVLGTSLEAAGHRVRYWARAGQPRVAEPFTVTRRGRRPVQSRPLGWISARDAPPPASDWVIVCVRTPQLTAALAEVVERLGAERSVAIATVTLDGARAAAHAAGVRGKVLALHVSFGSEFVAGSRRELTWFPFTPPSTVSAEGQAALRPDARRLARELARGGVPAVSALDMSGMMRLLVIGNCVLLPGWELSGWDIARLANDRSMRGLTARAMHECVRRFAPARGPAALIARLLPGFAYVWLLRCLPLLMGARARALWLQHGPKLVDQTRYVVHELLDRAARAGAPLEHLPPLVARWEPSYDAGSRSRTTSTEHGACCMT